MMKNVTTALILLFTFILSSNPIKGQSIELLAGNTLNGAVNGTLLGGAVMGLSNNSNFAPLRIGIGLGTLYGIGVGAYDISQTNGGQMIVTGTFNDGNNSSIIVLLDTFYGAAAGAVIASSVMLVANEPIVKGLQYGASAGGIAGFGFGIVDSFILSDRIMPGVAASSRSNSADGLVALSFEDGNSIGFISPSMFTSYDISKDQIRSKFTPYVNLINFKVNL
ncbi:MAG: hypothetical protein U5K71_14135 [Gracilimonas sp.]|nr:hypothetical protein [Gracilimonas sp.]